jgi:hypothetical protein
MAKGKGVLHGKLNVDQPWISFWQISVVKPFYRV